MKMSGSMSISTGIVALYLHDFQKTRISDQSNMHVSVEYLLYHFYVYYEVYIMLLAYNTNKTKH